MRFAQNVCGFITGSSVWMQKPNCCTLSSVLLSSFTDSVTHINITVATTEKAPELRTLGQPLGCTNCTWCSGELHSNFSPVPTVPSWIHHAGPLSGKSVGRVPARLCKGSGQDAESSSPGLSACQSGGFPGPVSMRQWHTKRSGCGNSSMCFWWALPLTSEASELQSSRKQLPCCSERRWRRRRANFRFLVKSNSTLSLRCWFIWNRLWMNKCWWKTREYTELNLRLTLSF